MKRHHITSVNDDFENEMFRFPNLKKNCVYNNAYSNIYPIDQPDIL